MTDEQALKCLRSYRLQQLAAVNRKDIHALRILLDDIMFTGKQTTSLTLQDSLSHLYGQVKLNLKELKVEIL